jgi:hypothetical protein
MSRTDGSPRQEYCQGGNRARHSRAVGKSPENHKVYFVPGLRRVVLLKLGYQV